MPGRTVSRRFVVGVLGSGAAAAPLMGRAEPFAPGGHDAALAEALVAPLHPGARLGRFRVVRIAPLSRGAVTLSLAGAAPGDRVFHLEILARDPSPFAPKPPATTAHFAVHVCNGGDGWLPTNEEQGLAAMALAEILAANEHRTGAAGFLTHAERIARHRASLLAEHGTSSG